jgi:heme a synthase
MENNTNRVGSKLGKFSLLTLIAVYFLIFVGGIVRSTGSGMGCPDWPKCFGSYIPPTSIAELPDNYKEVYSQKRAAKNVRLASYLNKMGFTELADKITNDKSILEESDFNVTKTWIEYINRLLGVLIGIFIIITFYLSIKFIKTDIKIFIVALLSLILVIFQGWIGALVVSTNLIPFMVTVHMLLALLLVALLCWIVLRSNPQISIVIDKSKNRWPVVVLVLCMIALITQIILGTQVREMIDQLAVRLPRNLWISNLGVEFFVHRSFSWIVLILHLVLVYQLYKLKVESKAVMSLIIIIIVTILTGTIMAYFSVPSALQPLHLLLGTLGFGLQFFLFLQLNSKSPQLV